MKGVRKDEMPRHRIATHLPDACDAAAAGDAVYAAELGLSSSASPMRSPSGPRM